MSICNIEYSDLLNSLSDLQCCWFDILHNRMSRYILYTHFDILILVKAFNCFALVFYLLAI